MNGETDTVYLDTNVLIGIVEALPELGPGQLRLLADLESGFVRAVTSELSLSEVLVGPMQRGDETTGEEFRQLLSGKGKIAVATVSRAVLMLAARYRAASRMKLPDAIHVATADLHACAGFVSSDRGIRLPDGMQAIVWDRLGSTTGKPTT